MRYNGVLDIPKTIKTRLWLLEHEIDKLGATAIESTPEGVALMQALSLLTDVISVYRHKRFGLTYEQRLNLAARIFYMGSV
jgi:hypothetical protein